LRIGIDIRLQNESGVGRYITNLVQRLKKADKDNEYVLINPQIRWHTVKEQLLMPFILYGKRLDLVHFPYFNVPLFYFGKFVVTIHDLTISHFNTGRASTLNPLLYRIKRMGYKFILWNAIHRAERVIVPTDYVKRQIVRNYGIKTDRVRVIYEGVDRKLKAPASRRGRQSSKLKTTSQKLKLIKPQKFFLYVGNSYPHKNLERLIKAYQLAMKQWNNEAIKMVLVGKEDYFYKKLRKRVKQMKLNKDIVFTGHITDKELAWAYQNAIALVFPSLFEGFGLPALEAMANGCLVICSDIPSLREICGNAAIFFNPKDLGELLNEMHKATIKPAECQEKIKLAHKRAAQFSWEKAAVETLKVYSELFKMR
jgi:glycosyltransferase involved in cell wall biosynthesis